MSDQTSPQGTLWENFFRKREKDDTSLETLLAKVPMFSQLTDRELKKVGSIIHQREYDTNEYVFKQGDPGLGMYVIEDGEVEIVYTGGGGLEKSLALLKSGDFFGELSLLDESPRSASAIARRHSKIIGFFRPDLIALLDHTPKAGTKILFKLGEVIGTRLRMTNEQLGKMTAEVERNQKSKRGGKNADR